MRRLTRVLLILLGLLLAIYLGGSWYFSNLIIAFDTHTLAEGAAENGSPTDYDLPAPEDVRIASDDVTLAGWLFRQEGADCGVVMMHGMGATRYGMLEYAPLFWQHGCDLLLYDHRRHGDSTKTFGTFGYFEKRDAVAAIDWFAQTTGLQPGQIGLFGESYGATTGLQAAALRPDIAFVAVDSPFRDLPTEITEEGVRRYGGAIKLMAPGAFLIAGARAGFWPWAVSPLKAAASIQIPTFIVHSQQDDLILPYHSSDIFARIPGNRKILHLTDWGAGHTQSISANRPAYQSFLDEFLATYAPAFERIGSHSKILTPDSHRS